MYQHFDVESLEREYSPSTCVDDISVFLQQYSQLSSHAKSYAIETKSLIADIKYSHLDATSLDLFLPINSSIKRKLHVYIHGGYWQELSKNESCFAATTFQQCGIHFAALNYSLAPLATLSEIVEQIRKALCWLYHHADKYGYDKDQIYLSGSSAGAHLAMMMAATDWSKYIDAQANIVRGICAVSGIYDLTPIALTYINEPLQLTEKEILENSPLLMHDLKEKISGCNILVAYGANETNEFKRQSNTLFSHLPETQTSPSLLEIFGRNHFDVILELNNKNSTLFKEVLLQMQIS